MYTTIESKIIPPVWCFFCRLEVLALLRCVVISYEEEFTRGFHTRESAWLKFVSKSSLVKSLLSDRISEWEGFSEQPFSHPVFLGRRKLPPPPPTHLFPFPRFEWLAPDHLCSPISSY